MRFPLKVSIPTEAGSFALEGCTVRISREGRDPAWDSFVARCSGGHHEQTSLWGEVKGVYGWQSFRIVVTRENEILGGVQVLTRCVGRWGRIGYVSRGPLVASGDPELVHFILGQLDQAAVRERLAYLAVVLPYNGHVFEPVLHRLGFRQKPDVLPPSGLTTATLLLDLAADVDTLMAGMRASTRRNVRVAARQGVTVREGTGRDV
jgi:lipid II:glycine glycyltransferase (peptidoglycan interpeptide bridge formation enzyme)